MPIKLLCSTSTMESGGSERQMVQLLEHLHRDQFSPHLYLTYRVGALLPYIPSDVIVESFASQDASRFAMIPGSLFGLQINKMRRVIRRHRIQVTYDRLYHTVMLGAAATQGLKVARVVTVVSPPSQDFGKSRQRWMGLKRRILSWSYSSATRLLAVSEDSAEDASKFYRIASERWTILPSPIDYQKIRNNCIAAPPSLFSRGEAFNVAVLGRLSAEKNHQLLLQAAATLRQQQVMIHLHLIGDGVLRAELEAQVAAMNLQSQVTFYGVQANPHAIVARCDCLCLPSLYEGFPNVVMEAMVCRVPVLASQTAGGLAKLIGQNERGYLLDPHDSLAWCEKLKFIRSHGEQEQIRIAAADRYVQQNHDLPNWIAKMEEVFQAAALASNHRPAR